MRKQTIRITLVALAVAGTFLVVGSTRRSSATAPCDEESMEQCCKKKSKGSNDNLIWETLSGQFFTSSGLN
jgi:hypothetical protein